jgi:hypothetical protein
MQTIQVTHDFVLTLEDGTQRTFRAGLAQVDGTTANHWFVKAHSELVASAASDSSTLEEQAARDLQAAVEEVKQALAAPRTRKAAPQK